MPKENAIRDKSFQFALRIVKLYQHMVKDKKEFVISKQILRSGTAIGAMVEEALHGESRADFVHKLGMAKKEAYETQYWIRLLRESNLLAAKAAQSILEDNEEISRLLTSIILTAKSRARNS